MRIAHTSAFASLICLLVSCPGVEGQESADLAPAEVSRNFIFETASFEECHASTICETADGLVAAWFGGPYEKHPRTSIWLSRYSDGVWSPPTQVADGIQFRQSGGEEKRFPCWNPVLTGDSEGRIHLFYKVGPSPSGWWGMVKTSLDGGDTWSNPTRLPDDILGPIKNKPFKLDNDFILCPSSTESYSGWRVHFEISRYPWTEWTRTDSSSIGSIGGAIQPSILRLGDGRLKALCRSDGRAMKVLATISNDQGLHWLGLEKTVLPNPNSGLDVVTLQDGRHVLVYNHTQKKGEFPCDREMLNVALSVDGEHWMAAKVLEKEVGKEFSYPAIIQSADGKIHITYTWNRKRIAHLMLDPSELQADTPITGDEWPLP